MAHIDSCNSLLYGVPIVHLYKLQRLQNAAAGLVCKTTRYSHITPVLFDLHWLPVKFRIHYKIAILAFKSVYAIATEYLCNLVITKDKSHYGLRSNNGLLLSVPRINSKNTLGDCAFIIAAPKVWNELPLNIRNETIFSSFERLLKTHYFRIAFELVS